MYKPKLQDHIKYPENLSSSHAHHKHPTIKIQNETSAIFARKQLPVNHILFGCLNGKQKPGQQDEWGTKRSWPGSLPLNDAFHCFLPSATVLGLPLQSSLRPTLWPEPLSRTFLLQYPWLYLFTPPATLSCPSQTSISDSVAMEFISPINKMTSYTQLLCFLNRYK